MVCKSQHKNIKLRTTKTRSFPGIQQTCFDLGINYPLATSRRDLGGHEWQWYWHLSPLNKLFPEHISFIINWKGVKGFLIFLSNISTDFSGYPPLCLPLFFIVLLPSSIHFFNLFCQCSPCKHPAFQDKKEVSVPAQQGHRQWGITVLKHWFLLLKMI